MRERQAVTTVKAKEAISFEDESDVLLDDVGIPIALEGINKRAHIETEEVCRVSHELQKPNDHASDSHEGKNA